MTRASASSIEEHKTRIARVWKDFEEYRRLLDELKGRVDLLEDIPR